MVTKGDREMKKAKSKRPTVGRPPGRKPILTLRIDATLLDRLRRSSEKSDRTVTEETVRRLELSFDRQDLLTEVLRLTVGEEVAALLNDQIVQLAELGEDGRPARQVTFGRDTDGNLYTDISEGRKGHSK